MLSILDPEHKGPLTRNAQIRARSPELADRVDRACWMRCEGFTFRDIALELSIAQGTAKRYVRLGAPELA